MFSILSKVYNSNKSWKPKKNDVMERAKWING